MSLIYHIICFLEILFVQISYGLECCYCEDTTRQKEKKNYTANHPKDSNLNWLEWRWALTDARNIEQQEAMQERSSGGTFQEKNFDGNRYLIPQNGKEIPQLSVLDEMGKKTSFDFSYIPLLGVVTRRLRHPDYAIWAMKLLDRKPGLQTEEEYLALLEVSHTQSLAGLFIPNLSSLFLEFSSKCRECPLRLNNPCIDNSIWGCTPGTHTTQTSTQNQIIGCTPNVNIVSVPNTTNGNIGLVEIDRMLRFAK